jgi:TrwC relaxase
MLCLHSFHPHRLAAGQETGQWHEADLSVAHWLQHTSRDGDMQLHVHSQIARTGKDGKWRAPDSLGYGEHVGAVAAITAQHLEDALTASRASQHDWSSERRPRLADCGRLHSPVPGLGEAQERPGPVLRRCTWSDPRHRHR